MGNNPDQQFHHIVARQMLLVESQRPREHGEKSLPPHAVKLYNTSSLCGSVFLHTLKSDLNKPVVIMRPTNAVCSIAESLLTNLKTL